MRYEAFLTRNANGRVRRLDDLLSRREICPHKDVEVSHDLGIHLLRVGRLAHVPTFFQGRSKVNPSK